MECNRCHSKDTEEVVIAVFKNGDGKVRSEFVRVICNECGQEFTDYRLYD